MKRKNLNICPQAQILLDHPNRFEILTSSPTLKRCSVVKLKPCQTFFNGVDFCIYPAAMRYERARQEKAYLMAFCLDMAQAKIDGNTITFTASQAGQPDEEIKLAL